MFLLIESFTRLIGGNFRAHDFIAFGGGGGGGIKETERQRRDVGIGIRGWSEERYSCICMYEYIEKVGWVYIVQCTGHCSEEEE